MCDIRPAYPRDPGPDSDLEVYDVNPHSVFIPGAEFRLRKGLASWDQVGYSNRNSPQLEERYEFLTWIVESGKCGIEQSVRNRSPKFKFLCHNQAEGLFHTFALSSLLQQ
jgi:hypothetical protein